MAWARNGTPDTLGSDADVMTISDLTAKKFNFLLQHCPQNGNINANFTVNNSGADSSYAYRYSDNGGSDATGASGANIPLNPSVEDIFSIMYFFSNGSNEPLFINFSMMLGASGSGTAPNRHELVGKRGTTTAITRVDCNNAQPGSYATGSNLTAIGTD